MPDRAITPEIAALIKGMLARGDDNSNIAAWFLVNQGRISEIATGKRFAEVAAAPVDELPPPPPYASPHELWKVSNALFAARVAVEWTLENIPPKLQLVLNALRDAEGRLK